MGDAGDDRAARARPLGHAALTATTRALLVAWASPASLIGALAAPFFRRRSLRDGVLLCEGASWPRRLGWGYRAITFGHVVLSVDAPVAPQVWRHELHHVRQYERWGVALLLAYPLASLWALLRGRHPYRDNPFEISARTRNGPPG